MDSIERLRKAAKNDIPAVLELLRRQASDLAQVVTIRWMIHRRTDLPLL